MKTDDCPETRHPTEARARILVVDDDPRILQLVIEALEPIGHDCRVACSVNDALRQLDGVRYDLIITDIRMPNGSGFDILRALPRLQPGVPAIIMTAYPSIGTAVTALRMGVVEYLTKPFHLEAVRDGIEKALAAAGSIRVASRTYEALSEWEARLTQVEAQLETMMHGGINVFDGLGGQHTPVGSQPVGDSPSEDPLGGLSPREHEVAQALAAGQRPRDVAERLGLSLNTVRSHMKSIYRKLRVHSHVELVRRVGGGSSGGPTDDS